MEAKEKIIKQHILDYENGEIEVDKVLEKINALANTTVNCSFLDNYFRSMSMDDFVKKISYEPIENWKDIDKETATKLLQEMFTNLIDDALLDKNATALEKKYSLTEGIIIEWIFQEDLGIDAIMEQIKISS